MEGSTNCRFTIRRGHFGVLHEYRTFCMLFCRAALSAPFGSFNQHSSRRAQFKSENFIADAIHVWCFCHRDTLQYLIETVRILSHSPLNFNSKLPFSAHFYFRFWHTYTPVFGSVCCGRALCVRFALCAAYVECRSFLFKQDGAYLLDVPFRETEVNDVFAYAFIERRTVVLIKSLQEFREGLKAFRA